MKTYSKIYIFIYASVMIIIVAAVLSFTAISLKPLQDKNIEIEKKQDILSSINVFSVPDDAEEKFNKYITNSYVINFKGEMQEGDAFYIDIKEELNKSLEQRKLPILECTKDDGSEKFIIPVRGKGLWGPIWGYIALNDDYNTIYGATFGHEKETPGLGSDIDQDWFQEPFKGKQLFDKSGKFRCIEIVKGGAAPDNIHGVDGISGGTITSKGLEAMLKDCLSNYVTYFRNKTKIK